MTVKDNADDAATGLLKLHTRRDLDDAGTPRMTQAMLRVIAGPARDAHDADGASERDELADLDQQRKAAALARLEAEHARLYGIIFLTDVRGLSLRATGCYLDMDHHTVTKHRGRAIGLIRAWCADERQAG